MSNRWESQRVRLKYTFIKAHRQDFDTAMMCHLLDVSRSGSYQWLRNPLSDRAVEDQRLLGLIRAAYTASHGIYGAPRIFLDLREAGETCSKHRVARIMRANNLKARYGYRVPRYTRSPTSLLTPNTLERGFTVLRRNTAWVTDITYVRTWEGWLYLAVVMDLYSRRIVGWSTQPTLAQDLVLDALLMAVRRRKPQHVLIHSDQGAQFGSDAWQSFCRAHHLEPSMSRRGNCWDNAVAESFFSSLKKERIKKCIYRTRAMAIADIDEYIETFYNRIRRHSHLSGVSPEAFEAVSKNP
jgi:putative transposase